MNKRRKKLRMLTMLRIAEVSIVDRPANNLPFSFVKMANPDEWVEIDPKALAELPEDVELEVTPDEFSRYYYDEWGAYRGCLINCRRRFPYSHHGRTQGIHYTHLDTTYTSSRPFLLQQM